ncbi:inosine-5'-monophosphate dehydrogenase-like [Lolium rigidum]|uniref:inosine-5'-monophosphate dehydrogenase-like n=1 Tax=Lolium rigidum TaxID=89674 RepID=UPI001F5C3C96|nr:inosine-5'-monophosphate dehydrogenase-like [Lolium rigidum]
MASSPSAAVHCARSTLSPPSSHPRRAPAPASLVVAPRRRQRRGAAVVAAALGDMRPAIDENPEGVLSGEWPDNFSLVSYEDLRKYLESQIVSTDKMSPTAKLSEVMSRPVEVAMADQKLAEIDALFATQSGLPVLDGEGRCIGVVSKKDKAKASNGLDSTVAEVMSSPAITLTLDKTVLEAAALMLKHKVHRIPVVNEQLQVIGIVTRTDVFQALEEANKV